MNSVQQPKLITKKKLKFVAIAALIAIAAIATLLLNGHKTIHPAEPIKGVETPLPLVPISSLTIPIRVNIAALSDQINDLLSSTPGPTGIYWTSGQERFHGGTIQLGIHRSGNASVITDNGCLVVSVPLELNGRIDWEKRVLRMPVYYHSSIEGSAILRVRACFSVGSDWKLQASLSPDFSWVKRPMVDIHVLGLPKIDVSRRVEPKLREKLSTFEKVFSNKVSAMPLRTKIEGAWMKMQLPHQLSQQPLLTLEIEPISVGVGPAVSEGIELVIRPTVTAKVRVHAGAGTKPHQVKPLPANTGTLGNDKFALSIRVDAPFAELNRLAQTQLVGKPHDLGDGGTVKLNSVSISSLGDKVLMRVDFDAKLTSIPITNVSGWLYLTGRPRYDDRKHLLVVKDIDFDLNTRNILASSAEVLLHEQFRQKLEEKMVFDLSQKIDPIRKRVEAGVKDIKVADGVAFNADVKALDVSDIHIGSDGIGIFFTAGGTSNITVVPNIK